MQPTDRENSHSSNGALEDGAQVVKVAVHIRAMLGLCLPCTTERLIPWEESVELEAGWSWSLRKFKRELNFRSKSFIEILKKEVHDRLDPNPPIALKSDASNSIGSKAASPGKVIQIREWRNDSSKSDGDRCLQLGRNGSLPRARVPRQATNMNTHSRAVIGLYVA